MARSYMVQKANGAIVTGTDFDADLATVNKTLKKGGRLLSVDGLAIKATPIEVKPAPTMGASTALVPQTPTFDVSRTGTVTERGAPAGYIHRVQADAEMDAALARAETRCVAGTWGGLLIGGVAGYALAGGFSSSQD